MLGKLAKNLSAWWNNLRASSLAHRASDRSETYPRLYDVRLESRTLLNGDAPFLGDDGILQVASTAAMEDGVADRFVIEQIEVGSGESKVAVYRNGEQVWEGERSRVQGIHVVGSADADTLVIDPALGFPKGVIFEGERETSSSTEANDEIVFRSTQSLIFSSARYEVEGDQLVASFETVDRTRTSITASHIRNAVSEIEVRSMSIALDAESPWTFQEGDQVATSSWNEDGPFLELQRASFRLDISAPTSSLSLEHESQAGESSIQLRMQELDLRTIEQTRMALGIGSRVEISGTIQLSREFELNATHIRLTAATVNQDFMHARANLVASGTLSMSEGSRWHQTEGTTSFRAPVQEIRGELLQDSGGKIVLDSGIQGQTDLFGILRSSNESTGQGGTIEVWGKDIRIHGQALLDVSAERQGGVILLGGDAISDRTLPAVTERIQLDAGARLKADSTQRGDGGSITLWSEKQTILEAGSLLSAKGGRDGGKGGFIETSSRDDLRLQGTVVASSNGGANGMWLIDPMNINVVSSSITDTATTHYVVAQTISNSLDAGTNVTINTSAFGSPGDDLGDVFILASIATTQASSADLIIQADKGVYLAPGVSIAGFNANSIGLVIDAGDIVDLSQGFISNVNYVHVDTPNDFYAGGMSVGNGSRNAGVGLNVTASTIEYIGTINSAGGDIQLTSTSTSASIGIALLGVEALGGSVELAADQDIDLQGGDNSIRSSGGADHFWIHTTTSSTSMGIGNGAGGTMRFDSASIQAIHSDFQDVLIGKTQSGTIEFAGTDNAYYSNVIIDVSSGGDVVIEGEISTTRSGLQGNAITVNGDLAHSTITLAQDLITDGGAIELHANKILIESSGIRRIDSGNNAASAGGTVILDGQIDGVGTQGSRLEIDTRGTVKGGSVQLGEVVATSLGLRTLTIDSYGNGGTSGTVELSSVRLKGANGSSSRFAVNEFASSAVDLVVEGVIDLSESSSLIRGGSVQWGMSRVLPKQSSSSLTIKTNNLNNTSGVDSGDGGDIQFGEIIANGSNYFDSVLIDMNATDSANVDGTLSFGNVSNVDLLIDGDGSLGKSLTILGTVSLAASNDLTIRTNPGASLTLKSSNIQLQDARFTGQSDLTLNTSSNSSGVQRSLEAGDVFLGDVDLTQGTSSITIDTRASLAANDGQTTLDNNRTSATSIRVQGDMFLENTALVIQDDVVMETFGNGSLMHLKKIADGSSAKTLTLYSDGLFDFNADIGLTTTSLAIQIDRNNDQTFSFDPGAILQAASIDLQGSTSRNDTLLVADPITTMSGDAIFRNWSVVDFKSNVTSALGIEISDVSSAVKITGGLTLTATGAINAYSNVTGLQLVGASNSLVKLDANGTNGSIKLGPVTATNSPDLTLEAGSSVTLNSIDLNDGDLIIDFNQSSSTQADVNLVQVQAKSMTIGGNNQTNERVFVAGSIVMSTVPSRLIVS